MTDNLSYQYLSPVIHPNKLVLKEKKKVCEKMVYYLTEVNLGGGGESRIKTKCFCSITQMSVAS